MQNGKDKEKIKNVIEKTAKMEEMSKKLKDDIITMTITTSMTVFGENFVREMRAMLQDILNVDIFEEDKKILNEKWQKKLEEVILRAEEEKSKTEEEKNKIKEEKSKIEEEKSKIEEEKSKIEEEKRKTEEDKRKIEEEKRKVEQEKLSEKDRQISFIWKQMLKKFPDITFDYYDKLKKAYPTLFDLVAVEFIDMNNYKQLDRYLR